MLDRSNGVSDESTTNEGYSMVQKAEAIVLFVHDLAGCTAFYRDTLMLPYKGSDATAATFELQDGVFLIVLSPEGAAEVLGSDVNALQPEGGPRGLLAVGVEDVDGAYEELKAKGVTFVQLPTDKWWGRRMAHFTDPEGNLWQITQPIAAKPAA